MQGYSTGIQNGFLCPNDVRELENMNLIPEEQNGWQFLCNGSMQKLQDAGSAYEKKEDKSDDKILELDKKREHR